MLEKSDDGTSLAYLAPPVRAGSFGNPTDWPRMTFCSGRSFSTLDSLARSSSCTTLANPAEAQKR